MHQIASQKKEACVVLCGDPLILDKNIEEWNRKFGKGNWWLVLVLGGVKKLLSEDKEEREWVFREIRNRYEIAPFERIILINHSHCLAWERAGFVFDNPQEEEVFHLEKLKKAEEVIRQAFPKMTVEIHYFLKKEQKIVW